MPGCRVAIVGAGYTAKEHAKAFKAVPGVTLAGIFSRTRARAEALAAEAGFEGVYGGVAELREKARADLVVVTVNETSMKAVALECLSQDWTILLEKPAGLDAPESIALLDAARSARRRVFVAHNRSFYSSTLGALQGLAAASGRRLVRVQDQADPARLRALKIAEPIIANWMYANSIHLTDYFRLFARGRAVKVRPVWPWRGEKTDYMAAELEFESGDLGLYEAVWGAPGPWAVSVTAGAERWELRPLEQGTRQKLGSPPAPLEISAADRDFKPGFRLQAEHAVAAAAGRPSSCVTLEQSVETMRLTAALYGLPGA